MLNIARSALPVNATMGAGALVLHGHNVMDPMDRTVFRVAEGTSLRQAAPITDLPMVAMLNGQYIHPDDWEFIDLESSDYVGFMVLPQGGGGNGGSIQTVLGLVLIVVGVVMENPQLIVTGVGLLASGLSSPPSTAPISIAKPGEEPSPTYSFNLSGNTARLAQAIPVPYGRHIITPDFASNPYTEFDSSDNQFYHALLCFGAAESIAVEAVTIDDTVLEHFVDVSTQYIGPGFESAVTLVDPAVVNAPEVASQEMIYGQYIGPFASSGAGLLTHRISIDIVCPKGLYFADDSGNLTPKTVSWLVEARKINDNGAVAGIWFPLGFESITLAQNSPVRRSYFYEVTPARYEVRVQRQEIKDSSSRAAHDVVWAGLRSYIQVTTSLNPHTNYFAVKIKATNQLSGLSQRKFAMILRRKLPTWNPTTGWSAPVETRSIAWALADVLRNTVYGGAHPDSRVDLQTLYELDQIWAARGDTFNGIFDQRTTIWEALTRIAKCGRARPIMRGNVITFARDGQQDLPVALFNMRNIKRESFSIGYKIPNEDDPDGIVLEFFDETKWASAYVTQSLPTTIGAPIRPARISVKGITNLLQAQRETIYMAYDAVYRPTSLSFVTEMEGFLPTFGDLIAVAHDVTGWGVSGELEQWDGIQATCTEDLQWTMGPNYAFLSDEYGDVHGPYLVTPGSRNRSMVFQELPDFDPYVGTDRERTRFAMGPASAYAKLCRITEITPASDDSVQITAVVEDNRVHLADVIYAGDGNYGGSGGSGGSSRRIAHYAPSGIPNYNAASDAQRNRYGFFSDPDRTVGVTNDQGYVYDN